MKIRSRSDLTFAAAVLSFIAAIAFPSSCSSPSSKQSDEQTAAASASAPKSIFSSQGPYRRTITTKSPQAQAFFDQGLNLMFAFNLEEAERSFREAARLDPDAAMAWWGIAYANGPHYNDMSLSPERARKAHDAIQIALQKSADATASERALIQAMSKRYASDPNAERKPLDEAYAKAMKSVWKRFPKDPDVGSFYAEAMMDLRPWNLYTHYKKPVEGTPEIVSTLESVLRMHPEHTGALHLYIHAVEPSKNPGKSEAVADRLAEQTTVTGGGHLIHMPSHIYMLIGRYDDAVESNRLAAQNDRAYLKAAPEPKHMFYMYAGHNLDFMAAAGMMEGRSEIALASAKELQKLIPVEIAESMPAMLDFLMVSPYEVMSRFERWDDLLNEPAPPSSLPLARAYWHYGRGLAFSAKGRFEEARNELRELDRIRASVPSTTMQGLTPAKTTLGIASLVLNADLLQKRGETEQALARLDQAIRLEDSIHYDEPADWYHPVRQIQGALLLRAGKLREAEKVFRDDLKINPKNGWSLYGLWKSVEPRDAAQADRIRRRFEKSWARADVPPMSGLKPSPLAENRKISID